MDMKKHIILFLALSLLIASSAHGLTIIQQIGSPGGCPVNLTIKSRMDSKNDDFIVISVRFKPHEPDPYKGRVKAFCWLKLIHDGDTLMRSGLETRQDKGATACSFRIHKKALSESKLTVSSSLYERDGLQTVGGSVIYEVALNGWAIDAKP